MILDLAASRADLTPDRPALWWDGSWLSYATLNARAERLAATLHEAGVRKGDRVAILAQNHVVHFDLLLATAKLGFIHTPLNYRLSSSELQQLVASVRPVLVLHDAEFTETASSFGVPLVSLDAYDEWLSDAPVPPAPSLTPEDPQLMLFTGGTTGLPKGALLPYRQSFYNAVNTVMSWGLREDDCVIQAAPCFHAAINVLAVPLLHAGGRVVLVPSFKPEEFLELMAQTGVTLLFLVPPYTPCCSKNPHLPKRT